MVLLTTNSHFQKLKYRIVPLFTQSLMTTNLLMNVLKIESALVCQGDVGQKKKRENSEFIYV